MIVINNMITVTMVKYGCNKQHDYNSHSKTESKEML